MPRVASGISFERKPTYCRTGNQQDGNFYPIRFLEEPMAANSPNTPRDNRDQNAAGSESAARQQDGASEERPSGNPSGGPSAAAESTERLSSKLEQGRRSAASQTEAVADAVRGAAERLAPQNETLAAYANRISEGAATVAGQLRTRSLDELAGQAQQLARANPAMFVAGSFFVGLAVARFMKSSGRHATAHSDHTRTAQDESDVFTTQSAADRPSSMER